MIQMFQTCGMPELWLKPSVGQPPALLYSEIAQTITRRMLALLTLSCSGDFCKGQLTVNDVYSVLVRPGSPRRGRHGRAGRLSSHRLRPNRRAVTVVLG
jgi:hypothetical protein